MQRRDRRRRSRSASALLVRRCRMRLLRDGFVGITWRAIWLRKDKMMTVPEITPEAQQQAEASVAGPAAEVLERLAEKLGSKASVSAVFGEPVARAGITIIPVARVGFGFGAGAGGGRKQAEVTQGGGGGGGASAAPVGYIEIKDGNAVFKPIRDPLVDVVVPLATLVAGFAARRMARRLLRRR
jgi:Sporulation protein YtfJ (Spore_YtfJ)